MKNKTTARLVQWLGLIVVMTVIGFSFAACDNGPDKGVAPTITTASLQGGTVGTAYSQTLEATGDEPVTWSIESGALPTGLILQSDTISGTPTAAGTSTFTVRATNAAGSDTKQLSIRITDTGVPKITTTTLPNGVAGTAYSQTLRATGGTPITWSIDSDELPAGLSLGETTGAITGTPTEEGTSTFTVKATNDAGNDSKQLSITIIAVVITTTSLPDGVAGTAYSQTLKATGGTPITWSHESGTLPEGLSLATTGTITGTPTAAGTSTFTVKAANAAGSDTRQLSITIGEQRPEIEGMVWIQGGTFMMGSPESDPNHSADETQHQVALTGFYMGKYPVTQAQYQAVTGTNPSDFRISVSPETSTANRPVETVTWYDAVEFCNKLSEREGLTPVYTISGRAPVIGYPITSAVVTANWSTNGYRLPTEAQWEYACRAGTTTAYNTGDTIIDNTGWYDSNSDSRTHSVGEKAVNAWGLYDMHGNVYEWCWDWYGTYANEAQTDPVGAVSGNNRVIRGGSWYTIDRMLRSAYRNYYNPSNLYDSVGFRLVRPAQ